MRSKTFRRAMPLLLSIILVACGSQMPSVEELQLPSVEEAQMPSEEYSPSAEQDITVPETYTEPTEELASSQSHEKAGPEEASPADVSDAAGVADASEISIIMVGDVLLHTRIEEVSRQEDGSYDYSAIFANMKEEISAADLALVNQEVIIGGKTLGISGYPAFNTDYSLGDELVETGFDVICHGTNHCLDKGRKGLLNCLNFWKENHPDIAVLGIHDSEESASEIYVYEQDGIRVAILNYTYGTNGIKIPEDMPFAVDLLEQEKVRADIERAEELADFTIVCPHWGTEYVLSPDSSQKRWNKFFLENGVDLVLGTHPHVIEPVELFVNEETGEQMLTYYSLGNFVNWTSGTKPGTANRMVGGMAQVTLTRNDEGRVVISDYGVEALVAHVTSVSGGVTVYPLSNYSEELARENEILSQASDFSYEYCIDLCNSVWKELWH